MESPTADDQLNEYATKIQSAYRGYQIRKKTYYNEAKDRENEFIVIKEGISNLTDQKHSITSTSDDLMLIACATKIQKAYRDYRKRKTNNQLEAKDLSISTFETNVPLPKTKTKVSSYLSEDITTPSTDTAMIESAIKIQRAYRSYHTKQMYKKVKQASIIFEYPECMSNVLQDNTETIERFYVGYQTRKMYKKWKKAALAIQSFYRIKKKQKRLDDKKEEDQLQQCSHSSDKLKYSGYSYAAFLVFFVISFFLASFIISCLLISTCRIHKTHHHIF